LAARLKKVDAKLGTLTAGKLADVVVVDGNPLEDLSALNDVRMTFLAGKRMV
jgi:imidazolonepropionase-like amidohydrolase